MPYIEQQRRKWLRPESEITAPNVGEITALNVGDLNYQITNLVLEYVEFRGLSYQTINDVIGVLECAKQEFYRRVAAPYEDRKKEENGDVY